MGNLWETPLKQMVAEFRPQEDPIVGPILTGGPAQLVRDYDLPHADGYVDECHLCYEARGLARALGKQLAQVYGVK